MLRKILVGVCGVVFLLFGFKGLKADGLKMKPYLYTQDFEDTDPVKFWVASRSTVWE